MSSERTGQRVLVTLRRMISAGELAAGERLAEIPLAERLGVSRMPVRMAFRELEQEGLLVRAGARGFAVRAVSPEQIIGAVEVRGVLEGLAARLLAERGASEAVLDTLKTCLKEGDALFENGCFAEADAPLYLDLNIRFHAAIIQASGNLAIQEALSRNDHLPFASVKALAIDRNNLAAEYKRLNYAHIQHHAIVEAIAAGQGARAEALMREHANAVLRYTELDPAREGVAILRGS
ncbi:GntR family transcriptional regulator [Acidocella aminolytica]|uniref:Transcriptional regulator GntR n=1 Tax=Acidocella aminolytica 101 = DSM 11237 TaxID=1120923 RepID=A0A0D6PBV0_9PROT|nr:GntR family transcriptional regulator [Acidocella aminolytica]GAN78841.1 transcriptional regulator GntR [Acidocella aminolytica 101 = DSM 11237]SHF17366.1 GntR family transcriptional regulator, vanillate catabolism transcriptional regulator [Acidocella aminolytica 101 = DSM 11237]